MPSPSPRAQREFGAARTRDRVSPPIHPFHSLRSCDSRDGLFGLLRELGYPVQPVNVAPSEWRGAGIDLDFDSLALAARMPRLDCYVADDVDDGRASRLLKSLHSWNVLTKSVLFARAPKRLALYDLSP